MSERVHIALSEGMAESATGLREQASRTLTLAQQEAAKMIALAEELEDAAETLAAIGDVTMGGDDRIDERGDRVALATYEPRSSWDGFPTDGASSPDGGRSWRSR